MGKNMAETNENISKSKKTLFVILIILAVGAFALVFYQNNAGYEEELKNSEVQEEIQNEEEKMPVVAEEAEEIADIMAEAISNQDASVCEKFEDENLKNICKENVVITIAMAEEDLTICERHATEMLRNICKNEVIYAKALSSKDPALCEELDNEEMMNKCKEETASQ